MFAGVGPSALVISEFQPNCRIWAVEINPIAVELLKENVRLNRAGNITVIKGDVLREVPKLGILFDRIVMPRPQLKDSFLREAFSLSKKGTRVYYYDFCKVEDANGKVKMIYETAKKCDRKIKIIKVKNAGEIAPYKVRVRIDFEVRN